MKLVVKLALLSTAGMLATSAFAETILPMQTASRNSLYISGDAGYGALSVPNKNLIDSDYDDMLFIYNASHSTGGFAGGVNIGLNHALNTQILIGGEFGYNYNGKARYVENSDVYGSNTLNIYSSDVHFLATGTYLFNRGFNVFAKAGAALVDQKGTFSSGYDLIDDQTITTTEVHPMLAAGVGYQVRMVNIFVQYTHIFGNDPKNFSPDLFDSGTSFAGTVAVDTIKAGLAVNLAI